MRACPHLNKKLPELPPLAVLAVQHDQCVKILGRLFSDLLGPSFCNRFGSGDLAWTGLIVWNRPLRACRT